MMSHTTTLRGFTPSSLQVERVVRGRCLLIKVTDRKSFFDKVSASMNSRGSEQVLFLGRNFNCTEYF